MNETPSVVNDFVAVSSKHNVFKADIITDLRKNDNMVKTIEELCKIVAETMNPNIEYLGYRHIDQRTVYPSKHVQMYETINYCVEFMFKVTGRDDKAKEIATVYKSMIFEIPNLINNEYYFINGTRFYPIYQILDATTYHKKDKAKQKEYIMLKTLTLPIKVSRNPYKIIDVDNVSYDAYLYHVHIKKKEINMLLFFFSTIGFFTTIQFFTGSLHVREGVGDPTLIDAMRKHIPSAIAFVSAGNVELNSRTYAYFTITKNLFLRVHRIVLLHKKQGIYIRSMIACILQACSKKITIATMQDTKYWRYAVFGACFIKSKSYMKPERIDMYINSYIQLYDSFTKENVRAFERPKETIYDVLYWMFVDYTTIAYRDNWSIFYKRIRLSESQIGSLIGRLTVKMERIINGNRKRQSIKKFLDILTLPYKIGEDCKTKKGKREVRPSDVLVKAIINSDITKYGDSVNDMYLFNIMLKWTLNAPSTTSSKSPRSAVSISLERRQIHISTLGKISLNVAGAGDPGASGSFTPFVKLYDGFFKKVDNK